MALAIAREINVELTPREQARLANSPTVDPQAHDAYLKGRYYLSSPTEERVRKGLEQFEQAIRVDPNFGAGLLGDGRCLHFGGQFVLYPHRSDAQGKGRCEEGPSAGRYARRSSFLLGRGKISIRLRLAGSRD